MRTTLYNDKGRMFDPSCDADVIDTAALRERAVSTIDGINSRTPEQKQQALENRNRALSQFAGVSTLQGVEGDYMTLNIYRDSPTLDFVEMRNLPLGALPFYRTRYSTPIGFYMGSVNAMGSTVNYATNDFGQTVTPYVITSDEVMVPNLNAIYDMQRLDQRQIALQRLAHDLNIGIVNCNLNTVFGAADVVSTDPAVSLVTYYSGGGSFSGHNVYVLDPGVVAAGYPTTNVYNLATENGLTKHVWQALNDYSIQAGRRIRKIYVSSAGVAGYPVWRAMQDSATLVAAVTGNGNLNPANAVPEEMWTQFQRNDFRSVVTLDWFGLRVDIERQNWLPPGYVLVLTDEPASIMWDRMDLATGEDRAGTLEVPVNGYFSRRSEARNIATIRPDFALRNFLVMKVQ